MPKKYVPLAIAYDFDGTLAPGNMQEHDFFKDLDVGKKAFWDKVGTLSKKHDADNILMYMNLMLKEAVYHEVEVKKQNFKDYGSSLQLFSGIIKDSDNKGWFDRINTYAKDSGVNIEHYIISFGIREMIQGTKIAKQFKAIYASSFQYDHHGVAEGPALAVNYTSKTQYLFRINKGINNVYDHSQINEYVEKKERAVPFENMVFIGDGETDVPCFRLVKEQKGHSIAVYKPNTRQKQVAQKLKKEGRVNFVAPADYQDGKLLDKIVKNIIDKVAQDEHLYRLG